MTTSWLVEWFTPAVRPDALAPKGSWVVSGEIPTESEAIWYARRIGEDFPFVTEVQVIRVETVKTYGLTLTRGVVGEPMDECK